VQASWVNVDFTKKDGYLYKDALNRVMNAAPCAEEDVLEAIQMATNLVSTSLPENAAA
jgi:hypothetical protein